MSAAASLRANGCRVKNRALHGGANVNAEPASQRPQPGKTGNPHRPSPEPRVSALLQTLLARGEIGSSAGSSRAMSDFKGRHFEGEIVLWAVRWYCRYGVSYRDLEQMMGERGGLGRPQHDLSMGSEVRAGD